MYKILGTYEDTSVPSNKKCIKCNISMPDCEICSDANTCSKCSSTTYL